MISIVMPVHNAVGYVVASIHSVLIEREVPLELIIVDDGSRDGTMDVVRSVHDPRIRIVTGPRQGVAAAFNRGLQAAQGQYVARCDADDLYTPGRLSYQLQWLETHPDFGAIGGSFATIDARGTALSRMNSGRRAEEITKELQQGTTRTHFNTFLVRSNFLFALQGCRSFFTSGEDIDLQLRLGEMTRVWYDPLPTYQYRLHADSITHRQNEAQREFYEFTARRFLTQRFGGGLDDLQRGMAPLPPATTDFREEVSRSATDSCHEQIAGILLGTAWMEHRNGHKWHALRTALHACTFRPTTWHLWRSLLVMMVKPCQASGMGGG